MILAAPAPARRGVVVLTHKEAKWLLTRGRRGPSAGGRAALRRRMDRLKGRYAFGVHAGRRLSPSSPALDPRWEFVMATERLAPTLEASRRIPLSSAHFIPDDYGSPAASQRGWDVAHIATQSDGKQWPRFFAIAREMLDADPGLRLLGVATRIPGQSSLAAMAASHAGAHLGRGLVLVEPEVRDFYKGWHPRLIERILADTRVLCLLSEVEGSSKVVSEASMAGCRVVLYEDLIRCCVALPEGTGHITAMVPGQEAVVIREAVASFVSYRPDRPALARFYGERASLATLERSLASILGHPVELMDGSELRFRLPAHSDAGMPWLIRRSGDLTADLTSVAAMRRLLAHLEALGP